MIKMRIVLFMVLFNIFVFLNKAIAHDNMYPATLERVVDGDSLYIHINLGLDTIMLNQPLRIYGIDAPELRGKCMQEREKAILAKNRLKELLSEVFIIQVVGRSKFGERLVNIITEDGDIGSILVEEHLARSYSGQVARESWCP